MGQRILDLEKTGFAFTIPQLNIFIKEKTLNNRAVYTVETLAIMKALQWIEHNKIKRDYNLHRLAVFYLISIEFMSSLGRADILYEIHETH